MFQITRVMLLAAFVSCSTPRPHYYFSYYIEEGGQGSRTGGPLSVDERYLAADAAQNQEVDLRGYPGTRAAAPRGTGHAPRLQDALTGTTHKLRLAVSQDTTSTPHEEKPGNPKKNVFAFMGLGFTVGALFLPLLLIPAIVFSILGLKSEYRRLSRALLIIFLIIAAVLLIILSIALILFPNGISLEFG